MTTVKKSQTKKTAVKSVNAEDMLGVLNEITSGDETQQTQSPRPVLELKGQALNLFQEWVAIKALDLTIWKEKQLKQDALKQAALYQWCEIAWKTKTVPPNPIIKYVEEGVVAFQAVFQVQGRFSVIVPGKEANAAIAIEKYLVEQGLSKASAKKLVENELDFKPQTAIFLTRLVHGHYQDGDFIPPSEDGQSAASKLMQFVMADDTSKLSPLTQKERVALLSKRSHIQVRDGFLHRVFSYVRSAKELRGVFNVIVPVHYPSHAKFGMNKTFAERQGQLAKLASEIIAGTSNEE